MVRAMTAEARDRAAAAVRGRVRGPLRRPADRQQHHPGFGAVRLDRLLDRPEPRRPRASSPRAVAMAIDHCFFELELHRIEIAIRPENAASLRVVEKLGIAGGRLRAEVPAHRRRLARPPAVRGHPRGVPGRVVGTGSTGLTPESKSHECSRDTPMRPASLQPQTLLRSCSWTCPESSSSVLAVGWAVYLSPRR